MAKPSKKPARDAETWLKLLSPVNQRRARKWIAEAGEVRFMAIAEAATSIKRDANRPTLGYDNKHRFCKGTGMARVKHLPNRTAN
jgi:hypothetical protein